jgi:hypothetical protein
LRDCPKTIDDIPNRERRYAMALHRQHASTIVQMGNEDERETEVEEAEMLFVLLAETYVGWEKILDVEYKNLVLRTMVAAVRSATWNMGPECWHCLRWHTCGLVFAASTILLLTHMMIPRMLLSQVLSQVISES